MPLPSKAIRNAVGELNDNIIFYIDWQWVNIDTIQALVYNAVNAQLSSASSSMLLLLNIDPYGNNHSYTKPVLEI
jgi:hypothetical protein